MRGFCGHCSSLASSCRVAPIFVGEKGALEIYTYLGSLLGRSGLSLGERRGRGFLSLLRRLSLRKEDNQRILFTKSYLL